MIIDHWVLMRMLTLPLALVVIRVFESLLSAIFVNKWSLTGITSELLSNSPYSEPNLVSKSIENIAICPFLVPYGIDYNIKLNCYILFLLHAIKYFSLSIKKSVI